jgi:diguanylate cyclase (GGDEF)-like protein/PAS domain S-box-containing protein
MKIHGFDTPKDYMPIADVLRRLRQPPFNQAPEFTNTDIWNKHRAQMVSALIGLGLIVALMIRLTLVNRKLDQLGIKQKALLENQLIGIATVQDRTILWANPAFETVLGYEPNELNGLPTRVVYPSEDSYLAFGELAYPILERGEPFRATYQLLRKSGTPIWVDLNGVQIDPVTKQTLWAFLDISELKLAEEKIKNMAFFDPLTQLPNRRMLEDRLNQALAATKRSKRYGALLVLDLDHFKPLNDRYGHPIGDQLLIEAARRLKSCVRVADTVARFGGDEFVIVLTEMDMDPEISRTQAMTVAEKIRNSLSEVYELPQPASSPFAPMISHHCTVSIGLTLFNHHTTDLDLLFKTADWAMYQAKESGRNQVRLG